MRDCEGSDTDSTAGADRSASGSGLGRRHLLTATGSTVSLSAAGCLETVGSIAGGTGAEGPITIGALAPDPDSDFIGRGMARGARVAVDELNDGDGIDGRPVELVVGDTNSSPLEARRQYQRLVLQEDADVTVGIFDSPSLETVIEDIAEQQRLHLTTGAATSTVSRLLSENYDRYKYHFRVGPTNDVDLGRGLIDFLDTNASNIGWNSVAVLVEDYPWTDGPWNVYQDRLDDIDVDIAMQRRYPPATDDFSAIYDEVEAAGADTAFIATAHTGTDAMLDWSYPNRPGTPPQPRPFAFGGIHVPMQLPNYYEQTGGACRYGTTLVSAAAKSDVGELTRDFVSAYEAAYGSSPVYTGYTTYEAVMLYAHAVEETGTQSTDELIPLLEDVEFPGATGTIDFYGRDHRHPHDLRYRAEDNLFIQWQETDDGEGVQEVIWPEQHKTADYRTPAWL